MVFFSLCLPVEFDLIVQKGGAHPHWSPCSACRVLFRDDVIQECMLSVGEGCVHRKAAGTAGASHGPSPQDKPVFPANEMRKV